MTDARRTKGLGVKCTCWEAGGGFLCLYTEDPRTAKALLAYTPCRTTYESKGRIVAWQFRFHRRKLKFIERFLGVTLSDD